MVGSKRTVDVGMTRNDAALRVQQRERKLHAHLPHVDVSQFPPTDLLSRNAPFWGRYLKRHHVGGEHHVA